MPVMIAGRYFAANVTCPPFVDGTTLIVGVPVLLDTIHRNTPFTKGCSPLAKGYITLYTAVRYYNVPKLSCITCLACQPIRE
jgi:hypothetical protein